MEKLDRVRVLAPLYLTLYIMGMVYAMSHSIWGNLALAALDILGLLVASLIARRVVEGHQLSSWAKVGPKVFWLYVLLIGMAVLHLVGMFMPNPGLQQLFVFLPPAIGLVLYASYLADWFTRNHPKY